jgi:Flp pilus assembly protein TadG
MQYLKKLFAEAGGAEIAEAALVLPLAFLLLFGILWFGRAYNVYATLTRAAQDGARVAATQTCATCGNSSYASNAQPVSDRVAEALIAAKLDPSRVLPGTPTYCSCGTSGTCATPVPCASNTGGQANVCVQFDVQLAQSTNSPGSCGVAISFQYPYQFYFPFTPLNLQQILLKGEAEIKAEY